MYLLDDVSSKAQDDDVALLSDTERKKAEVEREVKNYLAFEIEPTVLDNPLVWWRDNQKQFPQLAQLARKNTSASQQPLYPSNLCSIGTCF